MKYDLHPVYEVGKADPVRYVQVPRSPFAWTARPIERYGDLFVTVHDPLDTDGVAPTTWDVWVRCSPSSIGNTLPLGELSEVIATRLMELNGMRYWRRSSHAGYIRAVLAAFWAKFVCWDDSSHAVKLIRRLAPARLLPRST